MVSLCLHNPAPAAGAWSGGMAERTNARLLKSREGKPSVGSNPTPSAGQKQLWVLIN